MVDLAVHTYTVWANRVSQGTTYVLVGLEHIPFGRSTLDLEIRLVDKPTLHLPLDFTRPAAVRLKLTLLSDDTGKHAPAMVHMKWRTDDMMRRPGSGIDFVAQMDSQGNSTGARTAFLPGEQGKTCWCVPGESELSLSPGRWEIGVRRGVEHELVFQEVEIRSDETTVCVVRPKRWVDMRKRGSGNTTACRDFSPGASPAWRRSRRSLPMPVSFAPRANSAAISVTTVISNSSLNKAIRCSSGWHKPG